MKATFKSIMKIFLTTETFGKEKCSGEIKNKKFVTFRIKLFSSLVMENGPAKINPELLFQLQIIQHPCLLFLTFKRSARKKFHLSATSGIGWIGLEGHLDGVRY